MKNLATYLLLCIACTAIGQIEPQWTATLDTNELKIGQQATLQLEARFDASTPFQFPAFADTLRANVNVIDQSLIDTTYDKVNIAEKIVRQELKLTSFDSGYYVLKPIPLVVNGDSMYTEPLLLTVITVPVDTVDGFKDIKAPEQLPFDVISWSANYWHWIVFPLIGVIAIITLAFFLGRRSKRKVVEKVQKPKEPLIDRALLALHQIEEEKLWQAGKAKQYYTRVTDVLRQYLEEYYGIIAVEATSDELLTSLRSFPIANADKRALEQVLTLADLAKFAKEQPLPNENEMCMTYAVSFIKNTYNPED